MPGDTVWGYDTHGVPHHPALIRRPLKYVLFLSGPVSCLHENVNTEELGNRMLSAQPWWLMQSLTDGYPDWGNDPKVPPGTPAP